MTKRGQINLFSGEVEPPRLSRQAQELARVESKLARAVWDFCRDRFRTPDKRFYAHELAREVCRKTAAAPASPDRILRLLRANGFIDYVVVSRSESYYRLTAVRKRRLEK